MSKPFKFRYVNEIVGVFVLLVVAALVVGIILAGRAQDWFEPTYEFRLELPDEGSLGLQRGAEIQILGTTVGRIGRIRVKDDGSMYTTLTIKGDFIRFVRSDSRALVKKKFGVAGDAYVEITQGRGAPIDDGAVLLAVKDTELIEIAQDILKQLQQAIMPLLEQHTQLAAELRSPTGSLMRLLANLETVSHGLAAGEGSAGQLLRDPAAAQQIERILAQISAILHDLQAAAARLPPIAETVGREVDALPGTVVQSQETLREAERLLEGIQQHWIIRKYVPQPDTPALIPPTEAGGP